MITDGVDLTVVLVVTNGATMCPTLAPICRWRVQEDQVETVEVGELPLPRLLHQAHGVAVSLVEDVVLGQTSGTMTVLAQVEGWMMEALVSGEERVLVYRVVLLPVEDGKICLYPTWDHVLLLDPQHVC